MQRRRCLESLVFTVLLVASHCAPVQAQDYPSRPIRLIVSSPAGSLVDVLSRLLTQDLGTRLGQSIVVDNRAGAMTQIALEALVRAPPDGYTLMIGSSELAMMPFLKKSYRYAASQDFTPVGLFASSCEELADWALAQDADELTYRSRFFQPGTEAPRAKARARLTHEDFRPC
jgi:tripartite-type tricarboxylate transporter receptor subunit TctC